jgi:hypothetical protein
MKLANSIAIACLIGMTSLTGIPERLVNPQFGLVQAADVTGLNFDQKIDLITKGKGKFGGGDALRRFFFGDLEPVGIQPGGAGMVVNLYNKANNYTFSYCATYDVVVALRKGKVKAFAAAEVK